MLPPHLHPRAANYVVAVHGNTTTYMYEENGARLVTQELTPGHGTIFPQGSMHMMMNTGMSSLSFFLPWPRGPMDGGCTGQKNHHVNPPWDSPVLHRHKQEQDPKTKTKASSSYHISLSLQKKKDPAQHHERTN